MARSGSSDGQDAPERLGSKNLGEFGLRAEEFRFRVEGVEFSDLRTGLGDLGSDLRDLGLGWRV